MGKNLLSMYKRKYLGEEGIPSIIIQSPEKVIVNSPDVAQDMMGAEDASYPQPFEDEEVPEQEEENPEDFQVEEDQFEMPEEAPIPATAEGEEGPPEEIPQEELPQEELPMAPESNLPPSIPSPLPATAPEEMNMLGAPPDMGGQPSPDMGGDIPPPPPDMSAGALPAGPMPATVPADMNAGVPPTPSPDMGGMPPAPSPDMSGGVPPPGPMSATAPPDMGGAPMGPSPDMTGGIPPQPMDPSMGGMPPVPGMPPGPPGAPPMGGQPPLPIPIIPPTDIGKIEALKSIQTRLLDLSSILDKFSEERYGHLKEKVIESIEVFNVMVANYPTFKDKVLDIAAKYKKFIRSVILEIKKIRIQERIDEQKK